MPELADLVDLNNDMLSVYDFCKFSVNLIYNIDNIFFSFTDIHASFGRNCFGNATLLLSKKVLYQSQEFCVKPYFEQHN